MNELRHNVDVRVKRVRRKMYDGVNMYICACIRNICVCGMSARVFLIPGPRLKGHAWVVGLVRPVDC